MQRFYKRQICLPRRKQRSLAPIIFSSLITAATLMACQPATTKIAGNTRQIESTTSPVSLPAPEPKEAETGTDIVGNIISQLETKDDLAEDAPAPADEVLTVAVGQSRAINTYNDKRAALAQQALNAALSLLKDKKPEAPAAPQPFKIKVKTDGQLRIGLMLPFTGEYAALGQDIASGVEMALFQLADPNATLVYFDTAGGSRAAEAARVAIDSQIDIVIGPLFTRSAMQVRTIFAASSIPAISLSNNIQAATPGQWVLGYLPEQQIDHLLGYAIAQNRNRIAILASEDTFGQRLLSHTQNRLGSFGLSPAEATTLSQAVLVEEERLSQAVQRFTRYQKPDSDNTDLLEPAYDALILAGNSKFILRVAPLLSYYDMDPSRVMVLGTDLWARPELLAEPSLQCSFITQALLPLSTDFDSRYRGLFDKPTSHLVKLGFDAFALVAITHQGAQSDTENQAIDWRASLIRTEGFEGLSGRFNLLPDGQNQRFYEVRTLLNNKLAPF